MDSRKSNKIREIVRLQQILKKWKKLAIKNKTSSVTLGSGSKSIKFLKKTLSFTESSISSSMSSEQVPKGYIAVCTGKELKRFVIPMEYLGHQAFRVLLREAEEEFGFQQEGVLKIPCEVELFEKILKLMEEKKDVFFLNDSLIRSCYSPDCDHLTSPSHHPQMCR
ncbi:auxin-responsive protein SAUR32-like [Olea europaea var. sylvestris]|uniref:auxin-responsive protein SAUR32-like n=1 Tax=Olea europaea var. sylvestris TaxID=158386 RepID=UPI000C1CD34A|nr:auxin-responsive protein SAUR32-like [Olea europaea var. sylvestris]